MLHADLILRNANIATLDEAGRFVSALAARDGRIVATGDISAVKTFEGPDTQVIDVDGRTVIPGIVDSHCHPDGYAARVAGWQDVSPAYIQSRDALLARIESVCEDLDDGEWFLGYRLNENKSGGYPTLAELDQAGGGRPVFILRTDGHLGLANSAAFAVVGIAEDAADPPFGCFDRHPDSGVLTGLMRETATHLFLDHVHAADTPERIGAGLGTVFEAFLSHGITTVYNSLTGSVGIQAYQQLHEQGRLPLRVGIIISGREEGLAEAFVRAGIRSGFGDDWLRIIGVEWCPDCSTSGRTAAYYEAYQGTPVAGEAENNTGVLLYELEDLKRRASAAHAAGLLVMVEGVGDRGIDFALDVIEAALASTSAIGSPHARGALLLRDAGDSRSSRAPAGSGFLGHRFHVRAWRCLPRESRRRCHGLDVAAPRAHRSRRAGARPLRCLGVFTEPLHGHVVDGESQDRQRTVSARVPGDIDNRGAACLHDTGSFRRARRKHQGIPGAR